MTTLFAPTFSPNEKPTRKKAEKAEVDPNSLTAQMEAVIDTAAEAHNAEQTPRDYLGASRWGHHCDRALGYEYHKTPKDNGRGFAGKTLRIFDMGHDGETRMAEYLRRAGFVLQTEKDNGKQIGFAVARNEEGVARLSGHIDGVITAGPLELHYPLLWENKALGDKSWKSTVSKGVKESKPVYYAQMQVYMAYLDLPNGGLFTAINRDSGEIYTEFVKFVPMDAQAASDKAVRVISAQSPEELAKCSDDPDSFLCKWCDYNTTCQNSPF